MTFMDFFIYGVVGLFVGVNIYFGVKDNKKKQNQTQPAKGSNRYDASKLQPFETDIVTNPAYSSLSCNIHNTRD